MLHKNEKLTMVSLTLGSKRYTFFTKGLLLPNGKTVVSSSVIEKALTSMNAKKTFIGQLYKIG